MNKGAEFSECGQYRYRLWRIWNDALPLAMCIGFNPSTANADKNDSTIFILIQTLTQLGYGGFYMLNCWPYISTDPKGIKTNPMSSEWNNNMLTVTAGECKDVIFAWGTFKIVKTTGRDKELIEMFPGAKCFGINKNGSPFHPRAMVYIKDGLKYAKLIDYGK